jgi:hypothetical protein
MSFAAHMDSRNDSPAHRVRLRRRSLLCVVAAAIAVAGAACTIRSRADAALKPDEADRRVGVLIEKVLAATTQSAQQRAFDEIEALGCAAVPSIIRRMDDRRKLPIAYIALKNTSPNAFEAFRQYGPEEMVDALAAILNQLTGEHFEFIYNGATSDARTQSVAQWRSFLDRTQGETICR